MKVFSSQDGCGDEQIHEDIRGGEGRRPRAQPGLGRQLLQERKFPFIIYALEEKGTTAAPETEAAEDKGIFSRYQNLSLSLHNISGEERK